MFLFCLYPLAMKRHCWFEPVKKWARLWSIEKRALTPVFIKPQVKQEERIALEENFFSARHKIRCGTTDTFSRTKIFWWSECLQRQRSFSGRNVILAAPSVELIQYGRLTAAQRHFRIILTVMRRLYVPPSLLVIFVRLLMNSSEKTKKSLSLR